MCIVQQIEPKEGGEFACARGGCRECLENLMRKHDGLVYAVLRRQWGGQAEYEETVQAGRIGLWQAILHYDERRGVQFSSYAWIAIRNQIWGEVKRAWQEGKGLEARRKEEGLSRMVKEWEGEELRQGIREELSHLPERRRQVIEKAYGLKGGEGSSLAEIGREWGISRERVRQLRNDALVMLRQPVFSVRIRQLYEQNSRRAYRRAEQLNRAWQRGKRR